MLVRALNGAPAGRGGPPGVLPVVQTTMWAWSQTDFRSSPVPTGRFPAGVQEQRTRVSGVKAGPPLMLVLSLNSA